MKNSLLSLYNGKWQARDLEFVYSLLGKLEQHRIRCEVEVGEKLAKKTTSQACVKCAFGFIFSRQKNFWEKFCIFHFQQKIEKTRRVGEKAERKRANLRDTTQH